jgi:ankyrin repeat protein
MLAMMILKLKFLVFCLAINVVFTGLLFASEEPTQPLVDSDRSIPRQYICPITQEIMSDPVIASDGHSYEREEITRWIALNSTSPVTREPLENSLTPNLALRSLISDWREISVASALRLPVATLSSSGVESESALSEAQSLYERRNWRDLERSIRRSPLILVSSIIVETSPILLFHALAQNTEFQIDNILDLVAQQRESILSFEKPDSWNPVALNKMLLTSTENSNAEQVKLLLNLGADSNVKNSWGGNLMHLTAHSLDLTQELYRRNRSLRYGTDEIGRMPIHLSAWSGNIDVVSIHLSEDSKLVHAKSAGGWTPLHQAVSNGQPNVVRFLLERGAHLDGKVDHNNTLLHIAALGDMRRLWDCSSDITYEFMRIQQEGRKECARILISAMRERGIDPNATNLSGENPADLARARNLREMSDFLRGLLER